MTALARGDEPEFRRKWHQHEFVERELHEVIAVLLEADNNG